MQHNKGKIIKEHENVKKNVSPPPPPPADCVFSLHLEVHAIPDLPPPVRNSECSP